MTIGKREQIVIGAIAAIALIAILHVVIFAPSAQALKDAKQRIDGAAVQVGQLRKLRKPDDLLKFNRQTKLFLDELTTGITQLKLDQPEVFVMPTLKDTKLDNLPPGMKEEDIDALKKEKFDQITKDKQEKQQDLLFKEIERLRRFMEEKKVQLTFLGENGWGIPVDLPDNMKSGALVDQLGTIAELKGILDKMSKETQSYTGGNNPYGGGGGAFGGTTSNYDSIRMRYEQSLKDLGCNVQFTRGLVVYGEFVPLFFKLSLASLILRQIPSDRPVMILREELTRNRLFKLLEVDLPVAPLEGLSETKMYFAFEELRNLNNLLEMAQQPQSQVGEVTKVVFRGYAFLREQRKLDKPDTKAAALDVFSDDETDDPNVAKGGSVGVAGGGFPEAGGVGGFPGMPGSFGPQGMMGPGMMGPGMMGPGMMGPGMMGPGMMGPGMMGPGMMGPGMMGPGYGMPFGGGQGGPAPVSGQDALLKPRPGEIGYALPIKITFRANHINVLNYIYEVLRTKPMAEIHRLFLKSLSRENPNSTIIEAEATFIFVPKLFDTLDTVRKLITDIIKEGESKTLEAAGGGPTGAGLPGNLAR